MRSQAHIAALLAASIALVALVGCGRAPDEEFADAETPAATVEQPAPGPASERTVLVLCYHAMEPGAEGTCDVATEDFAEQLQAIADEGYESVLPGEIAGYLRGDNDLPEKSVCFTFDDGPESILMRSKPMLDEHGFTGAAFLITDSVGAEGKLSWQQVRELQQAGWEIGSHSVSHALPTKLTAEECRDEFEDSKAAIDAEIEGECTALAYPYGLYDSTVMTLAADAGYEIAFTIDRGPADWTDDAMRVPRQMVVNGNSLGTFRRWLAQEKLHLEDIDPAIGERVRSTEPEMTATVADEGVPPGELEISRDGNPVSYDADEQARTITFTPEVREGANNLRINYYGSPRREVSWVIVCEPD